MKKSIIAICALMASITAMNAQNYKVGDVYDTNGLKGIVIDVDASGQHGLIMSLDDSAADWAFVAKKDKAHKSVPTDTEAFDENDGQKNMEVIEKYINETGITWDYFPLFKWARELGDGWYIPAKNELKKLVVAINGGEEYDADHLKELNKTIKELRGKVKKDTYQGFTTYMKAGLTGFLVFNMMYCSTEVEGGNTYIMYFKEDKGSRLKGAMLGGKNKKGTFEFVPTVKAYPYAARKQSPIASRAVHKF